MIIKQTILLIEDRPRTIAHFTAIFNGLYPILFAKSVQEAIHIYKQHRQCISVILMSHLIHNESSLTLFMSLQTINPFQSIILYGPNEISKDIQTMLKLGATDYIYDIFNLDCVYIAMHDCLNDAKESKRIKKQSKRLLTQWLSLASLMKHVEKKANTQNKFLNKIHKMLDTPHFNHLAEPKELLLFSTSTVNNEVISHWIERSHKVRSTETLEECIYLLKHHKTLGLCLFHINTSDKNSFADLIQIKNRFPNISFITMSDFTVTKDIINLYKLGILNVISRPYSEKQIIDAINAGFQSHYQYVTLPNLVLNLFNSLFDTNSQLNIVKEFVSRKTQKNISVFIAELLLFYPKLDPLYLPDGFELPPHLVEEELIQFIHQLHLRFSDALV